MFVKAPVIFLQGVSSLVFWVSFDVMGMLHCGELQTDWACYRGLLNLWAGWLSIRGPSHCSVNMSLSWICWHTNLHFMNSNWSWRLHLLLWSRLAFCYALMPEFNVLYATWSVFCNFWLPCAFVLDTFPVFWHENKYSLKLHLAIYILSCKQEHSWKVKVVKMINALSVLQKMYKVLITCGDQNKHSKWQWCHI